MIMHMFVFILGFERTLPFVLGFGGLYSKRSVLREVVFWVCSALDFVVRLALWDGGSVARKAT